MSLKKKIVSAVLAAALCVSTMFTLTSCGDISYAMTINDEKINAGIYIYYEYQAIADATSKLTEEQPDLDTSAEDFDYYAQTVEGKSYGEWIQDKAAEYCKRYVAANELFDTLGLSFTADEKTEINDTVKSTWDDENQMLAYYGINFTTLGDYYESLGVGKASYNAVYTAGEKETKIFDAYYAVGGLEGTTQDEINTFFTENFAGAKYIKVELTDANGDTVDTSEGLQVLEDLANGYVDELNNGAVFSAVSKEYDAYVKEQEEAAAKAEAEANGEEYTPEEETEEEDTKTEDDYATLFRNTGTSPSEAFITNLFTLENDKAVLFKDTDAYYVVVRIDVMTRTDWLEDYTNTILHELKDEAMTGKYAETFAGYNVVINENAKSAYDPKKFEN